MRNRYLFLKCICVTYSCLHVNPVNKDIICGYSTSKNCYLLVLFHSILHILPHMFYLTPINSHIRRCYLLHNVSQSSKCSSSFGLPKHTFTSQSPDPVNATSIKVFNYLFSLSLIFIKNFNFESSLRCSRIISSFWIFILIPVIYNI